MAEQNPSEWSAEGLLGEARSYQPAALLAAAADLELFSALHPKPITAEALAAAAGYSLRGLTMLLDGLVALRFLRKEDGVYSLIRGTERFLLPDSPESVLAMLQHQANCLRNWSQIANVVKTGERPARIPSVRGHAGDLQAFIGAMHNVSAPVAETVVRCVQPLDFAHLLDVGGASGTWTAAFLRACPAGRATLFDVPEVVPLARQRLTAEGLMGRVDLVAGDYNCDQFPCGADLAWVSAIVHQNSRAQNRALFGRLYAAITPGGRIAIRDIVMEPGRTAPVSGALFAINMLVGTEVGGTFTLEELREDLESGGFLNVRVVRSDAGMNSVVVAER